MVVVVVVVLILQMIFYIFLYTKILSKKIDASQPWRSINLSGGLLILVHFPVNMKLQSRVNTGPL